MKISSVALFISLYLSACTSTVITLTPTVSTPISTAALTSVTPSPTVLLTPTDTSVEFNEDAFPLTKGAYWVYEGSVMWQEGDDTPVQEKRLMWKMEVVDTIQREHVRGYLLKGHPSDLIWYEPAKGRETHFIVQVGPKYYESDKIAWERLKDKKDLLIDLVYEGQMFLDLPLWSGKSFGETAQLTRLAPTYRWVVKNEQIVHLENIEGISPLEKLTQYTLMFQTLPDHTFIEFIPGIGITHFEYGHHGTISNVDMNLVEYHPGQ